MNDRRDPLPFSELGLRHVHGEACENADRRERERAIGLSFNRLLRTRLAAQEPRNIGAEELSRGNPTSPSP